ncbi:glycosyltransferase [Clostridium ganghwense]|uniref:Glycosyltransferase n=1 Tax=Clostridium ganghwense TaxID=312089 RepID=A0ABT4CNL3_9CLOT|nr:glycosyltransferase [Clostridium ganghwense]MCY6370533.1 glycosyltransferase [Clostridium ganghwense]
MKKKIYISSSLNTYPWKGRFDKEWIKYRIDIFMKYTLKSLKAQINQDFTATYMYHEKTEDIVKEYLDKYDKLPYNIRFIRKTDYKSDIEKEIQGYDYLYLARLDTDDMYHKTYTQQLHEYNPKQNTIVLVNQEGYLYDSNAERLGKYHHPSPPFFTLIYKVEDYLAGNRYKLINGHPGAIKLPHEVIKKRNFLWHVHSKNTADALAKFKPIKEKDIITDSSEVKKILSEFMGDIVYK